MKASFAQAALFAAASANSVPIFGTYPGWLQGEGKASIQIELFEDYLCSDCLDLNPVVEELMATSWLDGTVADQVTVGTTIFPLPYHVHAYQVAQLVPYFMDLCAAGQVCLSNEYKDFTYEN